jgi:hypothetical protein
LKKLLVTSVVAFAAGLSCHAYGQFASAVVSYNPGSLSSSDASYDDPDAALGSPAPLVGSAPYQGVYSPFDPHYETTSLTGIGAGGSLTLQLQNYVGVEPGAYEIGVWSGVGLIDNDYPNGTATDPATTFSAYSLKILVSANGTNWVALNGGNPISLDIPGNYYANATTPYDSSAPAVPVDANFGQPFTQSLSSFDGETWSQVLGTLDGSAGGTWLDLDGTGLSQVGFIQFDNTGSTDAFVSTVSIDSALAGSAVPSSVPEPGTTGMLVLGAGALALGFKRRRFKDKFA